MHAYQYDQLLGELKRITHTLEVLVGTVNTATTTLQAASAQLSADITQAIADATAFIAAAAAGDVDPTDAANVTAGLQAADAAIKGFDATVQAIPTTTIPTGASSAAPSALGTTAQSAALKKK
jgi:hypothetical protein